MAHQSSLRLAIAALVLLFLTAPDASADTVTFSTVRVAVFGPSVTSADLFANPGVTLFTNNPTIVITVLTHGSLPPGTSDTLRLTLTAVNSDGPVTFVHEQLIPHPGFPSDPIDNVFRPANFVVPLSYQGTSFTLTVDILGNSGDFIIPSGPNAGQRVDSYTYTFNIVQPVPEPATLILLGAGLAGVVARTRARRWGGRQPPSH